MAVKKRTGKGVKKTSKKTTSSRTRKPKIEVELPTELSVPKEELGAYSIILYGEEKIGKTTLASKFPNAFFLMCEPGGKALSIYQKPVTSWMEFKAYLSLIEDEPHNFETVVVDTVDILFTMCSNYVCQKLVIEHPSDEAYGKGWKALRDEFTETMIRMHQLECGLLFLSHATEKEITRRNGETSHRIIPTMAKQAREILEGLCDIIAYYHFNASSQRELQLEGDDLISAGCRLEHAFQKCRMIPMGSTSDEAYANFMAAYNNEVLESAPETAKKVVRKKATVRKKKK
jgi:hypothetical protein